MKNVWIGIDGGGTQTRLVMLDDAFTELARLTRGALQASVTAPQKASDFLVAWIHDLLTDLQDIELAGIAVALAGGGRDSYRYELRNLLNEHFENSQILIATDAEAAHTGAFNKQDGLLVMAGTGSLILGKKNGQWFRAGGYGPRIGDAGSACNLGSRAVRAACEDWDGGPPTLLSKMLDDHYGIQSREMVLKRIYRQKTSLAAFAPMLLQAAEDDDCARQILTDELEQFYRQMEWVLKKMKNGPIPVIFHGGLFNSTIYTRQFRELLQQSSYSLKLQEAQYPPDVGAVLMLKK